MIDPSPVRALEARLLAMPPVEALGLHLRAYDGHLLQLGAPLARNVNDKGNAFGGSLASVAMLSAWALMSVRLLEAGYDQVEVYVQDSSLRYLTPLYDDLVATATLAPGQAWEGFLAAFAQRGKARATLHAQLCRADGTPACTFEGRFVALAAR